MGNIQYNDRIFDTVILPKVEAAYANFLQARQLAACYNCPPDFKYITSVKEATEKINNIMDSLDRYKKWVNDGKVLYEQLSEATSSAVNTIQVVELKQRMSPLDM